MESVKKELIELSNAEDSGSERHSHKIEIYSMKADIEKLYPFMCKIAELDGRSMKYITKRKIMEAIDCKYQTKTYLMLSSVPERESLEHIDKEQSKKYNFTSTHENIIISENPILFTFSYQDIVYLLRAFAYNMQKVEQEYFSRLLRVEKMKHKKGTLEFSEILEEPEKSGYEMMNTAKAPSVANLEKSIPENANQIVLPLPLEKSPSKESNQLGESSSKPSMKTAVEEISQLLQSVQNSLELISQTSKALTKLKATAIERRRRRGTSMNESYSMHGSLVKSGSDSAGSGNLGIASGMAQSVKGGNMPALLSSHSSKQSKGGVSSEKMSSDNVTEKSGYYTSGKSTFAIDVSNIGIVKYNKFIFLTFLKLFSNSFL